MQCTYVKCRVALLGYSRLILSPVETIYTKRNSRKSKLCEIKAACIYDGKIALRVLDEYDLQDSFQKRINPGSRKLPAHNTIVSCEHDNSRSEFKKWKPRSSRALDEMETGGETSSAREEHIIS